MIVNFKTNNADTCIFFNVAVRQQFNQLQSLVTKSNLGLHVISNLQLELIISIQLQWSMTGTLTGLVI